MELGIMLAVGCVEGGMVAYSLLEAAARGHEIDGGSWLLMLVVALTAMGTWLLAPDQMVNMLGGFVGGVLVGGLLMFLGNAR
jgi:uncharacterized membrane protein YhhN